MAVLKQDWNFSAELEFLKVSRKYLGWRKQMVWRKLPRLAAFVVLFFYEQEAADSSVEAVYGVFNQAGQGK
ncbi:MAG: hypothetical protein PHQ44_06915 [Anaerovibrio sp.]|nr:hypothetical protein [Anaerovibrio sp.]